MNILVIGGTGFIGSCVVRQLAALGHSVSVLHRKRSPANLPAKEIIGDRSDLASIRPDAEIVIDMILSSGAQAAEMMNAFRGRARRVIAASSGDVYRACGVLHGSEDGPLEPLPLREDSPLRTRAQTYPPEAIATLKKVFGWVTADYDKIPVERDVMSDPDLPGTVVRLPMTYGSGDHLHRFWPYLKRMDDKRPFILMEEGFAQWRSPRGYIENVAAALVAAAISDKALRRIYNYAETPAFSELEWARMIAAATGWNGQFVVLPKERMPAHLLQPGNTAQHWDMDSTRIREGLGYKESVALEDAIRRTIDWERANPPGEFNPWKFDYAAEDAAASQS